MRQIRLHGRFGQPVGRLAAAIAEHAMRQGKHVQLFNSFAAFRPGGPMYAVVRVDDAPIRERSANSVSPDIVIVLDNSLLGAAEAVKGLKPGGVVAALGAGDLLREKAGEYSYVALDPFIAGSGLREAEAGIIRCLETLKVF